MQGIPGFLRKYRVEEKEISGYHITYKVGAIAMRAAGNQPYAENQMELCLWKMSHSFAAEKLRFLAT